MIKHAFPLIAAATLLGACSDDPEPATPVADDASAAGNVLEGSISDDMIPLETLKSQSPPAIVADADGEGNEVEESGEAAE